MSPSRKTPGPDSESDGSRAQDDHPAPLPALRTVTVAVGVEAAALAVAAVAAVVTLAMHGGRQLGMSLFLAAFALGVAWALVAAVRVVRAGRRGGRSVILTWQVFQAIVAASALGSGNPWAVALGVLLLALSLGVTVLLFTPRVVAATRG